VERDTLTLDKLQVLCTPPDYAAAWPSHHFMGRLPTATLYNVNFEPSLVNNCKMMSFEWSNFWYPHQHVVDICNLLFSFAWILLKSYRAIASASSATSHLYVSTRQPCELLPRGPQRSNSCCGVAAAKSAVFSWSIMHCEHLVWVHEREKFYEKYAIIAGSIRR